MPFRRKIPVAMGFTWCRPPAAARPETSSGSSSSVMGRCWLLPVACLHTSESKPRPACLQPCPRNIAALRAGARLIFGLLRDLFGVRREGIDEALVGVQRLPGHLPENLRLL